jgi:hypothetical protein
LSVDLAARAALVRAFRLDLKRDRHVRQLRDEPAGLQRARIGGETPRAPYRPSTLRDNLRVRLRGRPWPRVARDAPARGWVINHGLTRAQQRRRARRMQEGG